MAHAIAASGMVPSPPTPQASALASGFVQVAQRLPAHRTPADSRSRFDNCAVNRVGAGHREECQGLTGIGSGGAEPIVKKENPS